MYHDKCFQMDVAFPLVCFSHKQIKSSTTAGFLLVEKSKFEDIVTHLLSLNPAVLKDISVIRLIFG